MSEQGNLTRRRFLGVAGAATASVLAPGLAGCAGGDSGGSNASGGSGGSGGGGGKITLTWWDYFNDANEKAVNERIAAYKKVKPNVTIKRTAQPFADLKQKLLQGATAGELPDIVVIDNPDHSSFAALGVLADLTDQVKAWGQEGEYFEGPWKSTVYQGANYGVPDNSNCLALWSNSAMLEKAGVTVPKNWDDLRAAAKQLTSGKTHGIAMSAVKSEEGTFQWLPFLWAAGADLDSLDSDGGRQALQLWVDFVKGGEMSRSVVNWDQAAVLQQFENDRAALMVNGPWQIPTIKAEKPKLEWQVATLPRGPDQRVDPRRREHRDHQVLQARRRRVGLHHVDPGAGEPDALHRHRGQDPARARRSPSRRSGPSDPAVKVFVEQLQTARPRAYGPKYPEISAAVQDMLQSALTGDASVDAAVKTAGGQGQAAAVHLNPMTVVLPGTSRRARPAGRTWRRKGAPYLYVAPGAAVPAGARGLPDRLQRPQQPDRPQRRHVPGQATLRSSGSTTTRRSSTTRRSGTPSACRWSSPSPASCCSSASGSRWRCSSPARSRAPARCARCSCSGWLLPGVVTGNLFRWLLDGDSGVVPWLTGQVGARRARLADRPGLRAVGGGGDQRVGRHPVQHDPAVARTAGDPRRALRGRRDRRRRPVAAVPPHHAAAAAAGRAERDPARRHLHLQGLRHRSSCSPAAARSTRPPCCRSRSTTSR